MPRFLTKIQLSYQVHLDATDLVAAATRARSILMDVNFDKALKAVLPAGTHAQISYGENTIPVEIPIPDYTLIENPEQRLFQIFANSFKHSGPRVLLTDAARADAVAAYALIPEGPQKLRAHAAFNDYNIDLGVALCTAAIFTGEWFSYERNTYGLGVRGYDNGARWNGWACPLFSLKAMKGIVAWQDKQDKESLEGMDLIVVSTDTSRHSKVWMKYCADNGGELVEMLPSTHQTKDGPKELYEVGNGWCWEAYTGRVTKNFPKFKKLVG